MGNVKFVTIGEAAGMAENKTKPTEVSVAAFIEAIIDEGKRADAKVLAKLMQKASGEKPKMWGPSIVGFGTYHYKYDSGREGDMPVIGFSPRTAARSGTRSTVPSARTRSSTSATRSYSMSGLTMWRAKIFGRAW